MDGRAGITITNRAPLFSIGNCFFNILEDWQRKKWKLGEAIRFAISQRFSMTNERH